MNARRVAAVGVVVAAVLVAGCLGGARDRGGLRVTEIDGDWTEAGALELQVTVVNTDSVEATGTVVVRAAIDGGDTYTERREVTVPGSRTETVVVVFEPPAESVGSGFDANARME